MNLHSDFPYWMIREGLGHSYPVLDKDVRADVVVLGAGISGALIGYTLCRAGLKVVVADRRHIGHGSTSASTAMLQYEIDKPLFKLTTMLGKDNARRAYKVCAGAIDKLADICKTIPGHAEFEPHPSLLYASYKKHVPEYIDPEFEARKAAGFDVIKLQAPEIRERFGFEAPAGILSSQAAHVNPIQLARYLLGQIRVMGGAVYEQTEIAQWEIKKKSVVMTANEKFRLRSKYCVVACGYESQQYLPKTVTRLHSSYAIISKPLAKKQQWYKNALIWETKTPYLYLRTTADNRIIVGGRDEKFYSPGKRDRLINRKQKELEADFIKLFPDIPFVTDFAWAGTFGETKDGLPYIGSYEQPSLLYAMGYGGNGITFSLAAAEILRDRIIGRKNADAELFGFGRT